MRLILAVFFNVIFIGIISLFNSILYAQNNNALKLWYDKPVLDHTWEQALPIGNGRLGAMVYGIPQREELQLNEETIYAGGPYRNDHHDALKNLPQIQKLIFDGNPAEADRLLNQSFFTKTHGMPYQTAGSVLLNFPDHKEYQNYYRELDIERAVALFRYTVGEVTYTRQVFSSFADDVIMMQITASKKGALNFEMEYANPSDNRVFKSGQSLILEGRGSSHEGIKGQIIYQEHTAIKNKDGIVALTNNKITVSGATSVVLYISIATNFVNYKTVDHDHTSRAARKLSSAQKKSFQAALNQHTAIYNKQFARFKLNLGRKVDAANRPITQRIENFKTAQDPSLVALLVQFGRYLLICSSQPGGQPANLQGIWNKSMNPPWDSKYTVNINTEMNYWPAEVTNLSETNEPLFQMIKELSESGRETARILYGADGWVTHHNTDLWRVTSPIDFAAAGMWPTGGTWLTQHVWEHYLYTGDKKFLAELYPVMKGASDFILSILISHPKHPDWLVISPSISPEHGAISAGVTMDNQLAFDILTRTALASEILDQDQDYQTKLIATVRQIPPMQVGRYTQLQEWLEDLDDPKSDHRHVSHLYGLYPGNQISPYRTPELFEAARNSLQYRGDFATGWSIGWKINLWARLLDGNKAYQIIDNMLTLADKMNPEGRTYPNMFTAHPPFQIDGNFGLSAGVAEMLMQSHDGAVHVLPALPEAWVEGSVEGMVARGGFHIDMNWKDGSVHNITVTSKIGGNLRVRSYWPLNSKGLKEAMGENPNILLNPVTGKEALVSAQANLKGNHLRKVYEYDIPTQAGGKYVFVHDHQ
jgi:alpha-L-fucosidase 2